MKFVSNTGPIVGLAKIDQLSIFKELFGEINIPPMVYKELMGKFGNEWHAIETALNDFIHVVNISPSSKNISTHLANIDEGERQVILLSLTFGSEVVLIIDDKKGRQAAKMLGLKTTGLVGVLLKAKEEGIIDKVAELLEITRERGYWLSDTVIQTAKQLAHEIT